MDIRNLVNSEKLYSYYCNFLTFASHKRKGTFKNMMKKSHSLKATLAAMFMFCAMALAMTCGLKVEAATAAKISVSETGVVTGEAATYPVAIKVITAVTENGYTVKPGIYYIGTDQKLAKVAATCAANFYDNGTETAKTPVILATNVNPYVTDAATKTITSSIQLYTGSYKGKYYANGYAWTKLFWKNSTMYKSNNGAITNVAPTGRTPAGYQYYDVASNTVKTLKTKHFFKNGKHTTAVIQKEYYKSGILASNYTGWVTYNKKGYYIRKGIAVTGWQKKLPSYGKGVKTYTYYFNKDGVLDTNLIDNIGYSKFIQKDLKIITNKTTHNTTFYYKRDGEWVPAVTVICATAAKKGDTPSGTFRLEKTWNKRWFVYTKTNGAPYRYYQWAVHIKGTPTLYHSSTYRTKKANTLRADLYNKLGTSCTTHCIRLQAKYAKLIYDVATKTNKKRRVPVQIITSKNEGPFGHVSLTKVKSGTKWDPTDPNK